MLNKFKLQAIVKGKRGDAECLLRGREQRQLGRQIVFFVLAAAGFRLLQLLHGSGSQQPERNAALDSPLGQRQSPTPASSQAHTTFTLQVSCQLCSPQASCSPFFLVASVLSSIFPDLAVSFRRSWPGRDTSFVFLRITVIDSTAILYRFRSPLRRI